MTKKFQISLAISAMCVCATQVQADPCGTVLDTQGLVEIVHHQPHAITKANNGDPIECGDFIITKGKNSGAALDFTRGKMIVAEKTRIEIASAEATENANQKEVAALNLIFGKTRVLISKKFHDTGPRFEVRTPAAVVGVRGTDFFVDHDENAHETREATIQGAVEVSHHDSKDISVIRSGQAAIVSGRPEDASKPIETHALSSDDIQEIRNISRMAQYDPDFTHKEAVNVLGAPDTWDTTKADEEKRLAWQGSQFQHQTAAGNVEITPVISLGSFDYSPNAGSQFGATDTVFNFAVSGEYGINQMLSAGMRLAYATDAYSFSNSNGATESASGLADPMFFLNGKHWLGPGRLHFGGSLSISPDKQKTTVTGSRASSNEFTGGVTFSNYAGYELPLGEHIVGGRITFDLLQTDRNAWSNTSGGEKVKGVQSYSFVGFWEMPKEFWTFGADIGFIAYSSAEVTSSTSTNSSGAQMRPQIEAYGDYTATEKFTLLLKLGFGPGDSFIPNIQSAAGIGVYAIAGARIGI